MKKQFTPEFSTLVVKHGGSGCVKAGGVSRETVLPLISALDAHKLRASNLFEAHIVGGGAPVKNLQKSMADASSDERDEAVKKVVWSHAKQLGRILQSVEPHNRSISPLPRSPAQLQEVVSSQQPQEQIVVASFIEKGQSTDASTVETARLFELHHQAQSLILILTDQHGIYEADPNLHPEARQIRRANIDQLVSEQILAVGAWQALMKVIIDPVAVQTLLEHPMYVYVTKYENTEDIVRFLQNPYDPAIVRGTLIDPVHEGKIEYYR